MVDGKEFPPPLVPDPNIHTQIRLMLDYAEDRDAKISIIQTILRKHHEAALLSDLPRDLVLEAIVRLGNDSGQRKQTFGPSKGLAPISSSSAFSNQNDNPSQILGKERQVGHLVSAVEPMPLKDTAFSAPVVNNIGPMHVGSATEDIPLVSGNTKDCDHNNSGEEWNIVKGKHGGSRSTSPSVDRTRPAPTGSPKEKAPTEKSIPNRFSSLSNLEGDSSASVEDIAHTTERVMGSGAIPIENYNSTTDTSQEKTQVSILQLDKGTLPKMAKTWSLVFFGDVCQPLYGAIENSLDYYVAVLKVMEIIPHLVQRLSIEADSALLHDMRCPSQSPWIARFKVLKIVSSIQRFEEIQFSTLHPCTIRFSKKVIHHRVPPIRINALEMGFLSHLVEF
ncbi:hypothetical protein AAC387_Pa10g0654 [Persea americana]